MKCINCGNEVSSNELVCPYCGTSKSSNQQNTSNNQNSNQQNAGGFCIMCGKAVPSGYKMCPECTSGQLAEKSMPEKKKSYAGIIVLLSLLILLVGAVAVGFGTGIIPEFISEFSVEDAEPANETKDDSETEKDKNKNSEKTKPSEEDEAEELVPPETVVEIVVPNFNDSIITWTTAAHNARNSGGELASINSFEEFEKITAEADANGLIFLWIGAKRNESQLWEDAKWLDGTKMEFTKWLDKEPSYESDGEQECYLMLIKVGEEWYFNDTSNDITKFYNSEYYFSKSGYAVERVK